MQIVMEIDKGLYERIKYLEPHKNDMLDTLMQAVQHGTPLPKSYGDLIDRNELLKQPLDDVNYPSNYVRIAPVIIPATKGDNNADSN